jgi:hypothetical protein
VRTVELPLAAFLEGGDRRSIGRANEVASLVLKRPALFERLIACLWNESPVIRMRASDAAEKVSLERPDLLKPHKAELLGLLAETEERELRWHLAQMIPRLRLNGRERRQAAAKLRSFLSDRSSIVKTCAMQTLADLAEQDARLRSEVVERIEELVRTGTPAMRARGRKLLPRLGPRVWPKPRRSFQKRTVNQVWP